MIHCIRSMEELLLCLQTVWVARMPHCPLSHIERSHMNQSLQAWKCSHHAVTASRSECSQVESEYESANITVIEDEAVTKYSRLGVIEKQYLPSLL